MRLKCPLPRKLIIASAAPRFTGRGRGRRPGWARLTRCRRPTCGGVVPILKRRSTIGKSTPSSRPQPEPRPSTYLRAQDHAAAAPPAVGRQLIGDVVVGCRQDAPGDPDAGLDGGDPAQNPAGAAVAARPRTSGRPDLSPERKKSPATNDKDAVTEGARTAVAAGETGRELTAEADAGAQQARRDGGRGQTPDRRRRASRPGARRSGSRLSPAAPAGGGSGGAADGGGAGSAVRGGAAAGSVRSGGAGGAGGGRPDGLGPAVVGGRARDVASAGGAPDVAAAGVVTASGSIASAAVNDSD